MSDILHHPLLGKIRGKLKDNVIQFLGVKYATLKDRFAEPQLARGKDNKEDVLDSTEYGPTVVSNPEACGFEHQLIQHSLPHEPFQVSDTDGLNLNISVPSSDAEGIKPEAALPVFVYIHGGGFGIGSNSWPQYDLARLVRLSAEKGKPVVGVSINYRLGLPGFLTSSELRASGYRANNGLWDQRTALKWVKEFIQGFGGDSNNVTVIGQSAGGASATLHLYSEEPLFKRLIIIGGTHLMFTPLPPVVQEQIYGAVVQKLGLEPSSPEQRIEALKAIPVEDLYTKFGFELPLLPVPDDSLVPSTIASFADVSTKDAKTTAIMPGRKWCEALLIGDCQYDGIVFHAMLGHKKSGAGKSFCSAIRKALSEYPSEAEDLLAAYEITAELPDDPAFHAITLFGTDITFHAPTMAFAKGWPSEAYVFHFNSPNPWEGPSKGVAGHVLDVAFLFQNYNEFLSSEQKNIAKSFAGQVIDFAAGQAPFPPYDPDDVGAMVLGPPVTGAEFKQTSDLESLGRRATLLPIASRVGYDRLIQAWLGFMSGA